jgi:hypothetical protein
MALHHESTDPPLPGIRIEAYTDSNKGGKGFVVCYIPQGDFVPYRAEYAQKQYFIRVGDDSIIPGRVILRRLFYPQSMAKLSMSVSLRLMRSTKGSANITDMDFQVFLVNDGTASAHDVYVVAFDNISYPSTGSGLIHSENWVRTSLSRNKSTFHAKIPIHPGFSTQVASSYQWRVQPQYVKGITVYPNFDPIWVKFHVYSRDADYRAFRAEFNKDDLLSTDTPEKVCVELTDEP